MAKTIYPTRVVTTTPPTDKLVSLASVKARLSVTGTARDTEINGLIDSVSVSIPEWLGRPVLEQTREYYYSQVPERGDFLLLPEGPVEYTNEIHVYNGGWHAVTEYRDERNHEDITQPPRVLARVLATGDWPAADPETSDKVRVEAFCGWTDVPAPIKEAAMRQIVEMYVHKGARSDIEMYAVAPFITKILHPWQAPRWERPWYGTEGKVV